MAGSKGIKKIVLLSCGSFNPITNMHLRMFGKYICKLEQRDFCDYKSLQLSLSVSPHSLSHLAG
jgi:nicotinic acid mononucleotide adenylyltransferase